MNWIAKTLWDLIEPKRLRPRGRTVRSVSRRQRMPAAQPDESRTPRGRAARVSMQSRYDALVEETKSRFGVRVRKWRRSSSGVAWISRYHDGSEARWISAPYPSGPMSCAIFLHEIGHHAIGFGTYKPRCLEEYHAWDWALRAMRERGLNVTPAVERRMHKSLQYAIDKAMRRGLQRLPAELLPFASPLAKRRIGVLR